MSVVSEAIDRLTGRSERELLAYGEDCFKKAKDQRYNFERQWYTNLAFYFGKQYMVWTPSTLGTYQQMYEPVAPPWRVRLVANKIRPAIRKELAKVTKEKPQGFVIPNTTDTADVMGAKAGERAVEHLTREKKVNEIVRRAQFWNLLCGTAFIKDWYDSMVVDTDGQQGRLSVEPFSPFHVLVPDLQEETLEGQSHIIHLIAKSPEWVFTTYNKRVEPDASSGTAILESRFMSALGLSQQNTKNSVVVKEMWLKPNAKYKQGLMVAWTKDAILFSQEGWPYDHGEYPFVKLNHIPTGRFYGDSTIVDLVPLQREYNRTRSQIIESKNRMSKPQLMAYRGSVRVNQITSEPGLIIGVTPGFQMPVPLPLQSIPSYVMQELERLQRDMDDITSQHEITKGTAPGGVTAATAISYLQEEDDSTLAPTVSNLEESVEQLCRHFLSHINQFWVAQRLVQVVGANNTMEAFLLGKSAIKGNTNFRIETGSASPRSRASKQAFIIELMKLGVIPPDRGLRYLEMSETARMYEESQEDERQAHRENINMSMGQQVPVNPYDNDAKHILTHESFMKSQEFEQLAPPVKQLVIVHNETHKQKQAVAMGVPLQLGDPRLPQTTRVAPGDERIQTRPPTATVNFQGRL